MFSPGITALLENAGPFVGNKFMDDPQKRLEHVKNAKIFVVGAGGLGCEILKCLAFNGFKHIDIIDMDQIEVSNLNRQFLFRKKDVGRYKSEVAAEYVRNRVRGRFDEDIEINFHTCEIQKFDDDFYKQFDIVIGGLDNIKARIWMGDTLVRIAKFKGKIIPYIDGGTSAWQGNVKVVFPNVTACMECQRDSFPPESITFQACTLVSNPRKPEHCVFYAFQERWPQIHNEKFDADNDEHIKWAVEVANEHAKNHNLHFTVDEKYTRKVVKNTVAAIASTQAITASLCCTEAFKILTDCAPFLNNKPNQDLSKFITNQMQFVGNSSYKGINMQDDYLARLKECPSCSGILQIKLQPDQLLSDFINDIVSKGLLPDVKTILRGSEPILMSLIPQTKQNPTKKLSEIGLKAGDALDIASKTRERLSVILIA